MKSTAKATEKRSRTVVVLAIAVALMLLGSIFAQMFNTSFYKVKVSRISFDTDSGTLSGLLYLPKGVDASNPHPTIVTTHGYLNSAEMQDETAIEMSRRGYVVLALDMYDHGHSHGNADNTGGFFNFWPTSLWDAAQYMYSQDYVAKDAQGNGQIAVSGHSMGGFSSEMAIYLDEQNYAAAGYRIIKAGLSMGADYSWTSYLGLDEEAAVATFGGRTIGKICGQYDEFFFAADEPPTKSGTVYHKDYVATTAGKTLLEQEAPQADTWYTGSDGGQRIIYQPREIHPWNHFSTASTKDAIEFYATAFADQSGLVQNIASTSQIWYWKEVFELVALVGFLLMVPMFNKAAELCIPYFNALLGNVIPHSTLFITIIFCALAPLGLFRGPFTLYGCGAATLGILKGIGFSTAFLAPLMIASTTVMNVSCCITQSWIVWGISYAKVSTRDFLKMSVVCGWIICVILQIVTFVMFG